MKRIKEENEKKINELREQNEKIRENNHNEFMRLYNSQMSQFRELLSEIGKKKESNESNNNSGKTLEQRYRDIKNKLNEAFEEKGGDCDCKGENVFKAGILDEDDLITEEKLS